MRKIVCLFLCAVSVLLLLVSCNQPCAHEFKDGVCEKCDEPCVHSFSDGVCTVCQQPCTHSFEEGICKTCDYACVHTYDLGVCESCGMKNLSRGDLWDRSFKYGYFELDWSEDVTDTQKETLRKRFNVETDKELFDKLHEQYTSVINALGSLMVTEYEFQAMNDVFLKKGSSTSQKKFDVKENNVIIDGETFSYEKDRICSQGDSEDFEGVCIKMVFVEKEASKS